MSQEISSSAPKTDRDHYVASITRDRHPGVRDLMRWFRYEHLTRSPRSTSAECERLAIEMIEELPDSPELTTGLRKLLEAKDCFVRAALAAQADGSDRNQGNT